MSILKEKKLNDMKKPGKEINSGLLTEEMDVGTQGFYEFQSILLAKSKNRSEYQKIIVELLTIQHEMEDYVNSNHPVIKNAGEFLKKILISLHIPQNKFAKYLGLKPSNLNKLIKGERSINYELALIFGQLFNQDPLIWIKIQAKNEMQKLISSEVSNYQEYNLNDLILEK